MDHVHMNSKLFTVWWKKCMWTILHRASGLYCGSYSV